VLVELIPALTAVLTSDAAKQVLDRLTARAGELDAARAEVDEAVSTTDATLTAIERGDTPADVLRSQPEKLEEQRLRLTEARGKEQASVDDVTEDLRELIEILKAERLRDQAAAEKLERRARFGTAMGVIGVGLTIAGLVVAIIGL
jgi:hypothetical protein